MIVDANLLLYAIDTDATRHAAAAEWLSGALTGESRVGLPWQTLGAFVRIATNPRAVAQPMSAAAAWSVVERWLACDVVWVPPATERSAAILGALLRRHEITATLVTDAQLAALAIEHGVAVCSTDTDFARFPEVLWHNPLS